jgi:hypothetical protein
MTSAWIVGAFVFSWPSIVAVIINYVTRDRVRGTWLATHWRWQMRTFWFAALWLLVTGVLIITLIGIPAGHPGNRQHRPLGAVSRDPWLAGPARPARHAGAGRVAA